MNKEDIIKYLENIEQNFNESFRYDELPRIILEKKKHEVIKGNENTAKEFWCIEESAKIQNKFVVAFNLLKKDRYYDAWCEFYRIEISIHFLANHLKIDDKFNLKFINEHTIKYQKLFPYKIFSSAGILETEIRCNICDKIITPRNRCEHKSGEIYKGEICCRIITKSELVEYSLVTEPIDKCCVIFLCSENGETVDHYNYAFLKYLIKRLSSPFDLWDFKITKKIHLHSRYQHIAIEEKCPCESGIKYKDCCLKKEGVLRPHIDFFFSRPPSDELNYIEYT